jgi:Domain of unknown function (DUF3850)
MIHELKTWPEHYEPVAADLKRAELRKDDRDFRVGDVLWLREWEPMTQTYTGRACWREVTHILRGGPWLADGYAMMSVRPVEQPRV